MKYNYITNKKFFKLDRVVYKLLDKESISFRECGYYLFLSSINQSGVKNISLREISNILCLDTKTIRKYNSKLNELGLIRYSKGDGRSSNTYNMNSGYRNGFIKVSSRLLKKMIDGDISVSDAGYLILLMRNKEYEKDSLDSIKTTHISKNTSKKYQKVLFKKGEIVRIKSRYKISNLEFGHCSVGIFDPSSVGIFDPSLSLYKKEIKKDHQKYHRTNKQSTPNFDDDVVDNLNNLEEQKENQLESINRLTSKYGQEVVNEGLKKIFKTYSVKEIDNIYGLFAYYHKNKDNWRSSMTKSKKTEINENKIADRLKENRIIIDNMLEKIRIDEEGVDSYEKIEIKKDILQKAKDLMRINFPKIKEGSPIYEAQIEIYAKKHM